MSKKKPRSARQKREILQNRSPADLQAIAARAMKNAAYKEAIDLYKQLLKQEARPEWQAALADAYLERGRELVAKGMYKEAATLWENRVMLCNTRSRADEYLQWLLLGERYTKAAQVYLENAAEWEKSPEGKKLPGFFGALLLSGVEALDVVFDANPFWREQHALAEQALQAYCNGEDATQVEALLKPMPFRSPFRDFRTLLKALLALENDPAEAAKLAAKLPADSPYGRLMRLLPNPEREFGGDAEILTPRPGEEGFTACVRGWKPEQVKAFQALQECADDPAHLFEVVIRQPAFKPDYARQVCKQWLTDLPESKLKAYQKRFGKLSHFERTRLDALEYEARGRSSAADDEWEDCVAILRRNIEDGDNALRAALIQRHRLDFLREAEDISHDYLANVLKDCVRWNPQDKSSHLELIELYRRYAKHKKTYYNEVEAALKRFPKEIDVLLAAVYAAQDRKAFKKAAGYARDVLKIDPINVKAREILIASHVSHARKQLKAEKYHLVDKELTEAGQYERGKPGPVLLINRGLLAWRKGDNKTARDFLAQALEAAGNRLCGDSLVMLECVRADIDPALLMPSHEPKSGLKNLLRRKFGQTDKDALLAPLDAKYVPEAAEVLQLIRLLSGYYESQPEIVCNILIEWQPILEKAAKSVANLDDMLVICQFLRQTETHALLNHYAQGALKRWKNHPAFVFYLMFGKCEGNIFDLNERERERLEDALDRAEESHDQRSVVMIRNFLASGVQRLLGSRGGSPFQGIPPDFHQKLESIMDMGPDELMDLMFDGKEPSPRDMLELEIRGPMFMFMRILQKKGAFPPDIDIDDVIDHLELGGFNFGGMDDDDDDDDDLPFFPLPSSGGNSRRAKPRRRKK